MSKGNEKTAIRHISFHIIPFSYHVDRYLNFTRDNFKNAVKIIKDQAIESRAGKQAQWKSMPFIERERMYNHIEKLISNDVEAKQTIGQSFALTNEARSHVGLPRNTNKIKGEGCISFEADHQKYYFDVGDILLYLFESGVGFLAYEILIPPAKANEPISTGDLLTINNQIKRIDHPYENKISYCCKVSREETKEQPFRFLDMIIKLLEPLGGPMFFDNEGSKPYQAFVFSAALLEEQPNEKETSQLLFNMSRAFKDSYKAAPDFLCAERAYRPFENSMWAFSLEGLSNLCWLTDDEKTNSFFMSNYFGRLRYMYMMIFILALHQRYALINYSIHASLLPDLHEEKKETLRSLFSPLKDERCDKLREDLIQFTLRSNFEQVIGITHINDIYRHLKKALGIDLLIYELNDELNAISERAKMKYEERNNSLITKFTLIGLVFAFIEIIPNAWFIFTQFVWRSETPPSGVWGEPLFPLVLFGLSLSLFFILKFIGRKQKKHSEKKRKER